MTKKSSDKVSNLLSIASIIISIFLMSLSIYQKSWVYTLIGIGFLFSNAPQIINAWKSYKKHRKE